jgi:type IV pilus assembly protein PilC
MKYTYLAKSASGEISKGVIESPSQTGAEEAIEKKGLTPISVKSKDDSSNIIAFINDKTTFVSAAQKVNLTRQLATLISAGIPITQSMSILAEQTENKKIKAAVLEIGSDIQGGLSLSAAAEKQKFLFKALHISLMKAGELSGTLDESLERLADEIEKEHELSAKVKGAMIYPGFIFTTMMLVVVFMIVYVIPQLNSIFSQLGGQLPATTRFLMALSDLLINYGIYIGIGAVAGVAYLRYLVTKNQKVRLIWHNIIIRMPIIGKKVVRKVNMVRFSRTLGTMLSSGITALEALESTKDALQNEVYKQEVSDAIEKVRNGSSMGEAFKKQKLFPVMVSQMLSVGEETGSIDKVMEKVTKFYQQEVDNTIENLSSILQPLIMIMIGVMIAFLMISIILPIYQISSLF